MDRAKALQIMQKTEAQMTVGDAWREIVDPNFYLNAGWPGAWVDQMVRKHQTGDGYVLGVWHAEFLENLCKAMDINPSTYENDQSAYLRYKGMALQIWLAHYEEEEKRGKA